MLVFVGAWKAGFDTNGESCRQPAGTRSRSVNAPVLTFGKMYTPSELLSSVSTTAPLSSIRSTYQPDLIGESGSSVPLLPKALPVILPEIALNCSAAKLLSACTSKSLATVMLYEPPEAGTACSKV